MTSTCKGILNVYMPINTCADTKFGRTFKDLVNGTCANAYLSQLEEDNYSGSGDLLLLSARF